MPNGYTIDRDRATFASSRGWDMYATFENVDDENNPVDMTGATFACKIRDSRDNVKATLAMGTNLAILAGTVNTIELLIKWSVVKDWPQGAYYGDIVQVNDADSRSFIVGFQMNHGGSPTE